MLPCKCSAAVASDGKTSFIKFKRFALILKRQSNPLAVAECENCQSVNWPGEAFAGLWAYVKEFGVKQSSVDVHALSI